MRTIASIFGLLMVLSVAASASEPGAGDTERAPSSYEATMQLDPEAVRAMMSLRPDARSVFATSPSQEEAEDASPETADSSESESKWDVVVVPYAWLLSLDGDARVGPAKANINQSFSDVMESLSFAVEGRVEVTYDQKWGVTVDATFARLKDDMTMNGLDIDTEIDLWLVSAAVSRRIAQGYWLGDERRAHVDATVGVLSVHADADVSVGGPFPDGSLDEEWYDVTVGIKATAELTERLRGRVGTFVGGFDLGDSSDLSWGAEAVAGYQLGQKGNWYLWGGYRALSLDYDRSNFELDLIVHGPVLGAMYKF